MQKRILSALLCLLMIFMAVGSLPLSVSAESTTPEILTTLLKKFPHRAYWNHVGSKENNPDAVTDTPCPDHNNCSWVAGECTCNSFSNAIQCMGFAYKVGYDIVGKDPREWEKIYELDASKLCVGDIIRYRWNGHSLAVTGIKGNVISFVDANWYPMCQIRWSKMDLDDMPGFSYVQHYKKNKLKNKNIDFYVDSVEKIEKEMFLASMNSEEWKTNEAVNIRKKASTSSTLVYTLAKGTTVYPTQKTLKGGYLWGKISYGNCEGWIALDHCKYIAGKINEPQFDSFNEIQPLKKNFKLKWSAVQGADKYKVLVYDLYGNKVKAVETKTNSATLKLSETGKFLVQVKSVSDHASSWSLVSEDKYITVINPKEIKIETLTLSDSKLRLVIGEEARLTYSFDPYYADDEAVFWQSENPEIAEVDGKGNVLGIEYGKTNIVCKVDDESEAGDTCAVTVCPVAPVGCRQDTSKLSSSSVTLKWSKIDDIDGYHVYRKTSDDKFKLIATTEKTTYTDEGISSAKEFVYKIRAYVNVGKSEITGFEGETFSAVTTPEKVTSLTADSTKGKAILKWKNNPKASGYVIYQYSEKNDKYTRIGMTEENYFIANGKSGEKAYFKVRAIKTVNETNYASEYSSKVGVKIK